MIDFYDGEKILTSVNYSDINRDYKIISDDDIDCKCFVCNTWCVDKDNRRFNRIYGKFKNQEYNKEKIALNDLSDEKYKLDLDDDAEFGAYDGEDEENLIQFLLYIDCCNRCEKNIEANFSKKFKDVCSIVFPDKDKFLVNYISVMND
jgi:hypothetical protein